MLAALEKAKGRETKLLWTRKKLGKNSEPFASFSLILSKETKIYVWSRQATLAHPDISWLNVGL